MAFPALRVIIQQLRQGDFDPAREVQLPLIGEGQQPATLIKTKQGCRFSRLFQMLRHVSLRHLGNVDDRERDIGILELAHVVLDSVVPSHDSVHGAPADRSLTRRGNIQHVNSCVVDVILQQIFDAPAYGALEFFRTDIGSILHQQNLILSGPQEKSAAIAGQIEVLRQLLQGPRIRRIEGLHRAQAHHGPTRGRPHHMSKTHRIRQETHGQPAIGTSSTGKALSQTEHLSP